MSGTFSNLYDQLLHMEDLQEREKVFITPDSDDWNPHWEYFDNNENAMTNFEGSIVENKRKNNCAM